MVRGGFQSDIWETCLSPHVNTPIQSHSWVLSNEQHIPITVGLSAKSWGSLAWGWWNYFVEASTWHIWVQHVSEEDHVWFLKSKVEGC